MMPHERKAILHNGILKGNTKYNLQSIETIPFKYIKWLAQSQYCDDAIREYYLSVKNPEPVVSICIHCNETKPLEDMVPALESLNIKGVFHKSNVCQGCNDRKLALTSAKNICESFGMEFNEQDIPEEFIKAKMHITRTKRNVELKINKKCYQ